MKNIVLVGLSGSGKTTLGKSLIYALDNFNLIDTDEIIVKEQNMEIKDIFAKFGEEYFRNLETNVLKKISNIENSVISTGGGIVLREENIELLKQNGILFYLKTNPDEIIKRLSNASDRPLLETNDRKRTLENMLNIRSQMYEKADYIIVTDNKTPDEISDEIITIYKKER